MVSTRRHRPVQSRTRLLGHAIHPMLIVVPFNLLGMAAIFDLIQLATGGADLATACFLIIPAGILTGLLAAVFGFWGWLAIPTGTRARAVGLWHGTTMVVVMLLFAIAWPLRAAAGWLGGELVERLGVRYRRAPNLQASSSLAGEPARPRNDGPSRLTWRRQRKRPGPCDPGRWLGALR